MSRQNLKDFMEKFSLSQGISADDPNFADYSGADIEIALSLAFFNTMIKHKQIPDPEDDPTISILMDLLKEQSKAVFASSPNTDVYTKLGFRRPRKERVVDLGTNKTPT